MRITRRRVIWTVVVLLSVAAVVAVMRPTPIAVETATVSRETLRITIEEEGETRLRRRFTVSAPVTGRVERIEARPGDAVRAGQVLASIAPARPVPLDVRTRTAAEARVRSAESALEGARAELRRLQAESEQATREAGRTRTLFDAGSVAREAAELADVRARSAVEAVRAAEAAVRTADFALAEARAALISAGDLGGTTSAVAVVSPIDGLVVRRVQESESVIAAGAPLIEIGDLADLEIVADLLSRDAVRVPEGTPVVIANWGGARDLNGRVERVEPSGFTKISALGVEEQRVNVVIALLDPPSARPNLGDGFRVEVHIVLSERPGVLVTPTASLFRREGRWAVYAVDNGILRLREIDVGEQNNEFAEVRSGLSAGDRVVVYPGESLSDAVPVVTR